MLMRTQPDDNREVVPLFAELLDLVPIELHQEFGEVFYSGASAFEQPSLLYVLGFNPGGDASKAELSRYTIGADLQASRTPQRRDWSGFEDDWRDFGPGAVAFQRRVRHLFTACGSRILARCRRATPCSFAARASKLSTFSGRRRFFATAGWSTRESFQRSEYALSSALDKRQASGSEHGSAPARQSRRRLYRDQWTSMAEYDTLRPERDPGGDADPSERGGLDQPAERPNWPRGQRTGARKS